MRIEAYNQVQALYQTQQAKGAAKVNAPAKSDKLSISSFGKDIQTAKAAIASTPDVRTDIVADIKSRIEKGTYEVSAESFADKLLAKMNEL